MPGWASSMLIAVVGAIVGAGLGFLAARAAYRQTRRDQTADATRRDLDETRRLLLVLAHGLRDFTADRGAGPELGATVANAMSAHSGLLTTSAAVDFIGRVHRSHVTGATADVLTEIDGYVAKIDRLLNT